MFNLRFSFWNLTLPRYVIETVGLLVSSVVAAVFLDSVLVVWAVMGSTVPGPAGVPFEI